MSGRRQAAGRRGRAAARPAAPTSSRPARGLVLDGEEHWLTGDLRPRRADDPRPDRRVGRARAAARALRAAAWSTTTLAPQPRGLAPVPRPRRRLRGRRAARRARPRRPAPRRQRRRHSRSARLDGAAAGARLPPGPAGASKAAASRATCAPAATRREECIAVGDSREDLARPRTSGTFWLVANAVERDPTIREAIAGTSNVRVAEASYGAGVYEAVVTTLAGASRG